jgi:PHD/YefM family antitoxin component YafN of YafNO toxin-antitoxin module
MHAVIVQVQEWQLLETMLMDLKISIKKCF